MGACALRRLLFESRARVLGLSDFFAQAQRLPFACPGGYAVVAAVQLSDAASAAPTPLTLDAFVCSGRQDSSEVLAL